MCFFSLNITVTCFFHEILMSLNDVISLPLLMVDLTQKQVVQFMARVFVYLPQYNYSLNVRQFFVANL